MGHASSVITIGSPSVINDAEWNAMVLTYAGTMDSGGVARAGDSGQFDPYAVTRPGSTVYEVREFTSGATTYKVRIEWQSTRMRVVAGNASDGAGNITDPEAISYDLRTITSKGTGRFYVSSGTDYFTMMMNYDTGTSKTFGFSVGVVDGALVLWNFNPDISGSDMWVKVRDGLDNVATTSFNPLGISASSNAAYFPIFRHVVLTGNALPQEVPWIGSVYPGALADLGEITASVYGEEATWKCFDEILGYGGTTNLVIRW